MSGLLIRLVLSVAWSFRFPRVIFICSGISVVLFNSIGIARCHNSTAEANDEGLDQVKHA